MKENPRMAREDPLYRLRMPVELKELLADMAKKNHRSLNAEILARLEITLTNGQEAIQGVADRSLDYGMPDAATQQGLAVHHSIDRLNLAQRHALQAFLDLMLAAER